MTQLDLPNNIKISIENNIGWCGKLQKNTHFKGQTAANVQMPSVCKGDQPLQGLRDNPKSKVSYLHAGHTLLAVLVKNIWYLSSISSPFQISSLLLASCGTCFESVPASGRSEGWRCKKILQPPASCQSHTIQASPLIMNPRTIRKTRSAV